ncbi:MAG: helix-turn-helix domain-containing protein [Chloroflexi bacterium]|nr:MAG: helix-turn-helix domain-containing protein [Chloroflexota bacterium]
MAGLGQHIKDLRARAGLSQGALATRVNIDVTYLSKLENDRQSASEAVLRRLAQALGEDPSKMLVLAGRLPREMQSTFQASILGDGQPAQAMPPRYHTFFVDRTDDRTRLERMLEPGSLVAVTGPPGCGKTRLAAEVAHELIGRGRPIIWLEVREDDPDRMGAAAVLAHGSPESVLVLDDADRDLSASIATARRMVAAGITVVATSRQPLGIQGQRLLPLDSLTVPDRHQLPSGAPDVRTLQEQDSVKLFVARASLVDPAFELDGTNAPAVFEVVRWLDGLPLAIELAALRLGQMTVNDLAASLGGGMLRLLRGNTPDVPDRHSSLSRAIEWSFEHIDEPRRTVAARLSLFASTFTLEDAVTVAKDETHPRDLVETAVIDLVNCSLIAWGQNADRRAVYRWLRPIRQYARQQLDRADDREAVFERYRAWVQQVVQSIHASRGRRSEAEWARLAELTPELVSTVYRLPIEERSDAMNQVADALAVSLQFGNLAGHAYWIRDELNEAVPDVFREAGSLARIRGDYEQARRSFEQKHRIAVNEKDERGQANSLLDLAENAADVGQSKDAAELVQRASELYEKLESRRGRIEVLNLRGKIAIETRDVTADQVLDAERLFEDALSRSREIEDSRLEAYAEQNLGVGELLLGRIASARGHLESSLGLRVAMRNHRGQARLLEAFALVESAVGNHQVALRLIGAARRYRRSSGVEGIPRWWGDKLDAVEDAASVVLEPDAIERHLESGAALTLVEAGQLATMDEHERFGPLDEVRTDRLRRAVPLRVDRWQLASEVAAGARRGQPTPLDVALHELAGPSGGSGEAHRHVIRSKVLAIAEPVTAQTTDLRCFAIDALRYRGTIVPVFSSGQALAAALEMHPEWGGQHVVEVVLEQVRGRLVKGETMVVNPWTPDEHRFTATDDYGPAGPARASTSRSASA